jgi:hypothetical protein
MAKFFSGRPASDQFKVSKKVAFGDVPRADGGSDPACRQAGHAPSRRLRLLAPFFSAFDAAQFNAARGTFPAPLIINSV